jgi:hypothetical protein
VDNSSKHFLAGGARALSLRTLVPKPFDDCALYPNAGLGSSRRSGGRVAGDLGESCDPGRARLPGRILEFAGSQGPKCSDGRFVWRHKACNGTRLANCRVGRFRGERSEANYLRGGRNSAHPPAIRNTANMKRAMKSGLTAIII